MTNKKIISIIALLSVLVIGSLATYLFADPIGSIVGTSSKDSNNVWRHNKTVNVNTTADALMTGLSSPYNAPSTISILAACHNAVAGQLGCTEYDAAWLFHLSSGSISPSSHGLGVASFSYLYDGTNWTRWRLETIGSPGGQAQVSLHASNPNQTVMNRVKDSSNTQFSDGNNGAGVLPIVSLGFNNSSYDRIKVASASTLTQTTSVGALTSVAHATWSCVSAPAAGTQATCSRAAGGGSVRHVVTGWQACYSDTAAATAARHANLRDGATGAGTVLASSLLAVPVAGDSKCVNSPPGFTKIGTANTAMTIEFDAAGAGTSEQTVFMSGYSVL